MDPSQLWEQYFRSQEMPEDCPVCGGSYYDIRDDRLLVPEPMVPYCSSFCQGTDEDRHRQEDDAQARSARDTVGMALDVIRKACF